MSADLPSRQSVKTVFKVTVTNDGDEPAFFDRDLQDVLSEADVQPYIENVQIEVTELAS